MMMMIGALWSKATQSNNSLIMIAEKFHVHARGDRAHADERTHTASRSESSREKKSNCYGNRLIIEVLFRSCRCERRRWKCMQTADLRENVITLRKTKMSFESFFQYTRSSSISSAVCLSIFFNDHPKPGFQHSKHTVGRRRGRFSIQIYEAINISMRRRGSDWIESLQTSQTTYLIFPLLRCHVETANYKAT